MKISNIEDARLVEEPSSTVLKITLNSENLSRFPIEILYYKEQGFRHFLLDYRFEELSLPLNKFLDRLRENIFKVIRLYEITITLRGLPPCIFERDILRPGLRIYYESQLFLSSPVDNQPRTFQYGCGFCSKKPECSGIPEKYLQKYDGSVFAPLLDNVSLTNHIEDDISAINDEMLSPLLSTVLKDYQDDSYYLRKRLVFVRSFSNGDHKEHAKNRFVYYIYNRKEDFEQSLDILKRFGDPEFLEQFRPALEQSSELVVSGARMQGEELRTSVYFTVDEWDEQQLEELSRALGIEEIASGDLWGVGIDYRQGHLHSVKVYQSHEKIKIEEIKRYFTGISVEYKKKLNLLLNSCTKPLSQVLLDKRFINGEERSRRIDISMQYNQFKFHQLRHIIGSSVDFLEEKDPYTLSFEVSPEQPEKINIYYGPKTLPDLTPPEEEEPSPEETD